MGVVLSRWLDQCRRLASTRRTKADWFANGPTAQSSCWPGCPTTLLGGGKCGGRGRGVRVQDSGRSIFSKSDSRVTSCPWCLALLGNHAKGYNKRLHCIASACGSPSFHRYLRSVMPNYFFIVCCTNNSVNGDDLAFFRIPNEASEREIKERNIAAICTYAPRLDISLKKNTTTLKFDLDLPVAVF